MAFDYLETAQEAVEALAEFGALATVTRTVAAAGDDLAAPNYNAPAPATAAVTAFGAIFDYDAGKLASGNQPDALIRTGDRQLLFAALDVNGAAVTEEQLPIDAAVTGPDGKPYILKNVRTIGPAGVAVLFDCNVRRPAG